ncbi:MAG: N-acetylneuraminate synthase family protein [Bacteroidota bacterium]
MKIGNKEITSNDSYFWVEEGQASLGDFETAKKFIDAASEIGADGIEFQLAIPEEFYVDSHPYIEHYRKIQYTNQQLVELINHSRNRGIDFIATILSSSLVPFLTKSGCNAFVINASDINNPGIIDPVIESKLPFFISLPLASSEEIDWIVNRCKSKGVENYVLMQGQHTMASGDHGVSPEDSNLGFLSTLKEKYGTLVGYIDHSPNKLMPSVARAAGANFVCKHLFLRSDDQGPDWFICLSPQDMRVTIKHFKNINISLSLKDKVLAPRENMDKTMMRRSIVAASDIPKGTQITKEMLAFKRPGGGIQPNEYETLVGKITKARINKDEIINLNKIY